MTRYAPSEIRELWKQFWENKFHHHLAPCSLVADSENKSVLFNVAGMQQLVPYLVGKQHPSWKRLYNIQKCIRTNDIEDIWDERHCSTFEMMWNWSLGDYFKKDALAWSVEFLIKVVGLDINKLWATVFAGDKETGIPRDDESYDILTQLGIQHIKEMWFDENGESDNFWTPWPVWPCGPCTEFYYDKWEEWQNYIDPITGKDMPSDRDLWVNDRYTEIWNNVFMSYYRDGSWDTSPLSQSNVDTGMWFERLNMVLAWAETIFETQIFIPYINLISSYTDISYIDNKRSYRIILDHLRSAIFLAWDGVIPSNEWRWYVLRRIIRRMYYNINKIGIDYTKWISLLGKYVQQLCDEYSYHYDGLDDHKKIIWIIEKECIAFENTINNGISEFEKLYTSNKLDSKNTFKLFDTYGLPWDIINDLANEKSIVLDKNGFESELEKAKELSKKNTWFVKTVEWSKYISWIPETKFVWYDHLNITNTTLLKDFVTEDGQRVLIFDQTPFYATWWWQVWDSGSIVSDDGSILQIKETIKYAWVYLHLVDSD